jgi:hypothetical protein
VSDAISESEALNEDFDDCNYEYQEDMIADLESRLLKAISKKEFFKIQKTLLRLEKTR